MNTMKIGAHFLADSILQLRLEPMSLTYTVELACPLLLLRRTKQFPLKASTLK